MPRPDPRWPQWSTDLCLRHANLIGAAVFQVHCSTGVSPGTLFWDARSGRETSFKSLPLPALPSLLPLFSNGGETGQLFETDKLADQRLYNLWVFPPWTKGNGWGGRERERESEGGRKVSSSAFRANIGRNSAGDPNCPRFAYTPVSSRKRKKERERESFFLNCQEQFLRRDGCSSSRSLSRRHLFSLKDDPFVTWPIEYLPRTALRFVLLEMLETF